MCNGGQWYTIVSVLVQGHTAVSRFNVCSCIVVRSIEKTFTAFLNAQSNQLRVKSYKVVTRLYFCFFFFVWLLQKMQHYGERSSVFVACTPK